MTRQRKVLPAANEGTISRIEAQEAVRKAVAKEKRKPTTCQSVLGCSKKAEIELDNGQWLCWPCFCYDEKFC
jgi:hypothetical protein